MSLFSGFQNKQIQHEYDQLVSLLIVSLTKRVVKFYKNEECNESAFKNIINNIIIGLKNYEQQYDCQSFRKFMPPRFSENVKLLSDMFAEKEAGEVTNKINIQTDQLYVQKDFNTITHKANLLLHQDPQQLQPIKQMQIGEEMPPHPSQFLEKSEKSSQIESDKFGNTERNQELFVRNTEKSSKGISSMATPKRGSSAHTQFPISKEQLEQIEASITQNLLDKLTFQKKKKKSKHQDNSVQFRKLLLQPDKTNQSFSVTRRSVYNVKKD